MSETKLELADRLADIALSVCAHDSDPEVDMECAYSKALLVKKFLPVLTNTHPAPALTPKQEAAEVMFKALENLLKAGDLMHDALLKLGGVPMPTVKAVMKQSRSALAKAGRA